MAPPCERAPRSAAPAIALEASGLTLVDNERVGLLIDGADTAPSELSLMDVRVSASEASALGAIAQRAMVASDWGAALLREGVTIVKDASFVGTITPAGLLMPPALVAMPPPPRASIARATAEGDLSLLLAATLAMIATVVALNRLVWRRLYRLAEQRYRMA